MGRKTMTLRETVVAILRDRGPIHYRELTTAVLEAGLVESESTTPAASLYAVIAVGIKRKGEQSLFVRGKPGVFGLRATHETEVIASADADATPQAGDEEATDLRVPLFPAYTELRHLLRVWPGRPRKQIAGLRSTIGDL